MSKETLVSAAEVARLAGVGRAAVSNWRRRHADFPEPVPLSGATPMFRLIDVEKWLRGQGKLVASPPVDRLWRTLETRRGEGDLTSVVADIAACLAGTTPEAKVSVQLEAAMAELGDEPPHHVIEQLTARLFELQQRQHLATPGELADLLVTLAGSPDVVFDPACGPGNVLAKAAEHGATALFGQEIDPALARLATARLSLSASTRMAEGDALRADAFPDLQADAVLCDPPFGYRDWGHEELGVDPRWEYGFPVKGEPELAWLQHCLFHAKPGGSVVMVMPAGVAFRRSGRSIRQALLRRGALRAVIALPAGVLMSTGIPIHLWVLRNPERAGADPVLLLDTSEVRPERRGKVDWPRLRRLIHEPWRQFVETGKVEDVPGRQRTIEAIDLLDEDVDLTPARHLPLPPASVDAAALEAERVGIAHQLRDLSTLLPEVQARGNVQARSTTTLNDLARAGAVVLRQHFGRLETIDDADAVGPLVLTGRDLATNRTPAARLVDPAADVIELQAGDVVVPSVFAGSQMGARVIEEDGMVLGPNVQLIRADPERIDPHFLAGHLRARRSSRAASSTASGVHRLDVRRLEVPVLDIEEQRRLGGQFRQLQAFETEIQQAAERGVNLARALTDGLAEDLLHFQPITKRSQGETRRVRQGQHRQSTTSKGTQ